MNTTMNQKGVFPTFCLAVDDSTPQKVDEKVEKIRGVPGDYGIKLNLDLILDDKSIIDRTVRKTGRPIFTDLKAWNGKRTLGELVKKMAGEGASMINFWVLAEELLEIAIENGNKLGLTVLGVTVLTHYDDAYCERYFRYPTVKQMVRLLAKTAIEKGCDGYILPGTTLSEVIDLPGIKFDPAVRPIWFRNKSANYQKQIEDPIACLRKGAGIVSCGSPVWESPDPAAALTHILRDISEFQNK